MTAWPVIQSERNKLTMPSATSSGEPSRPNGVFLRTAAMNSSLNAGDSSGVSVGPGPHRLAPVIVKAGLAKSNSEANQKIKEGAVSLDGQKVTEFQKEYGFDQPVVLKLGRKFARVRA